MTAISIRHMNITVQQREHDQAVLDAAWYASLPADEEPSHYWHVVRKAKRGNRWIFHTRFSGTKEEVAAYWRKYFIGKKEFRLIHVLPYKHNKD